MLAASGEDAIAISDADDFAANVELAPALSPPAPRSPPSQPLERIPTPGAHTIEQLSTLLGVPASRCLKTLIVTGEDGLPVALLLRGDHELNAVKAQKLAGVANPLRMASAAAVQAATGSAPGSVGPIGLTGVRVYADYAALAMADFVCGANAEDQHFTGANWVRDLPEPSPRICAT